MPKNTPVYNFYKDLPQWAKGVSVVIILGITALASFGIYKHFKNAPPKVIYPNNGLGIPAGWDASILARKLHDAMKGVFTMTGTKDVAFLELYNLGTDDMFAAVYDTYNQLYMSEGDGTLRQWINDEQWTDFTTGVKDKVNERFERLGLK
jgi:hypothetical protein